MKNRLCLFTGMFFGYLTWLIFLKINGGKPYLTPQDKLDIHRMTSEGGPVPKEYSAL